MSDLINALEKDTRLKLYILTELYERRCQWVTSEEIAEKLGLNNQQIKKMIAKLRDDIVAFDETDIRLQVSKGRGALLTLDEGAIGLSKLKEHLITESTTYKIFNQIALGRNVTMKTLIAMSFLSESTIRKIIKRLNSFLYRYHKENLIQIKTQRRKILLVGDECQIHVLINTIYWQIFRGRVWPFQSVEKDKITGFFRGIAKDEALIIKDISIQRLSYILATRLIRSQKGHKIRYAKKWQEYIGLYDHIDFRNKYSQQLIKLGFDKAEGMFIILEFFSYCKLIQSSRQESFISMKVLEETRAGNGAQLLLSEFESCYGNLTKRERDQFIKQTTAVNIYADLIPNIKYNIIGYDLYRQYASQYPRFMKKIDNILDSMYRERGYTFLLNKRYLISKYLLIFSEYQNIAQYERPITIYLETDLTEILENNLIKQLENYFSNHFNIKICTDSELLKRSNQHFDAVFATSVIDSLKKSIHSF